MIKYNYDSNELITPPALWRLGFEEESEDVWKHLPSDFSIIKHDDNSFLQFIKYSDNTVGIPIMLVKDLILRCYSMTGVELKFNNSDEPLTAQ